MKRRRPNGDEYRLTSVVGDELDFIHAQSGVGVSFLKENDFSSFKLYGQIAEKNRLNRAA